MKKKAKDITKEEWKDILLCNDELDLAVYEYLVDDGMDLCNEVFADLKGVDIIPYRCGPTVYKVIIEDSRKFIEWLVPQQEAYESIDPEIVEKYLDDPKDEEIKKEMEEALVESINDCFSEIWNGEEYVYDYIFGILYDGNEDFDDRLYVEDGHIYVHIPEYFVPAHTVPAEEKKVF